MRTILLLISFITLNINVFAHLNRAIDEALPMRGFSIRVPSPATVDEFIRFIEEELAPAQFNMLVLMVDYHYAYESHPELAGDLTKADVKKIVAVCREHGIEIAPQINLFGHQSWDKTLGKLLTVYPEFDETPHVKLEDSKVLGNGGNWDDPDFFYCKSYCPLHPEVHKVLFDVIDELTEVFETKWFHAGMDEVTVIGDPHCPRCYGLEPARLFANEVNTIHNHLAQQGKRMMIWGDRLLDCKATGYHSSESSMNNTHQAIDMVPKDILICDWHYGNAHQSPVYFAIKGFDVVACPWTDVKVATDYIDDMLRSRQRSTNVLKPHFQGILITEWSGWEKFRDEYYKPSDNRHTAAAVVKMFSERSRQFK